MSHSSERYFGVEIECLGVSKQTAASELKSIGIKCEIDHRGFQHSGAITKDHTYHHGCRVWRIVYDHSIPKGFELVSPILNGEHGLEQVKQVTSLLKAIGATVDEQCGYHVHTNAVDLRAVDIKNLLIRYCHLEYAIDRFVDVSRRSDNNENCQSLSKISRTISSSTFDIVKNNEVVMRKGKWMVPNPFSNSGIDYLLSIPVDRGYKVNILSYDQYNTVEFRHHHGTVDPDEAVNWIKFCTNFVDQSVVRADEFSAFNKRNPHPYKTWWVGLDEATREFYEARGYD